MRILIAMMKHETNTFSPVVTDWARFADWGAQFGPDVQRAYAGTGMPVGAYMDLARARGAEIVTPVAAEAMPSGLVTADAYRGATVAPFDMEASREVLDLRILLETRLVQAAVEKARGEDIAELRVLASEFAQAFEAGDNERARAANYRFHHRMFEIAAMPQTLHFVQILWARYPFDLINQLKGRVSRAAEEHDEMLGAIIAANAAAAMLATRRHIEAGWLELRDSLDTATLAQAAE